MNRLRLISVSAPCGIAGMFHSLSLKRSSIVAFATAVATFVTSFTVVDGFAHDAVASFLSDGGGLVLDITTALVLSLATTVVLGVALSLRQTRALRHYRAAVDSMPQGLCMFDASERLVVCNSIYYEMYKLVRDDVKTGATGAGGRGGRGAEGT